MSDGETLAIVMQTTAYTPDSGHPSNEGQLRFRGRLVTGGPDDDPLFPSFRANSSLDFPGYSFNYNDSSPTYTAIVLEELDGDH